MTFEKWNYWIGAGALLLLLILALSMQVFTLWRAERCASASVLLEEQEYSDLLQARLYWASFKRPFKYVLPIAPVAVSSPVGYRANPMGGAEEYLHKGVDLVAPVGTPIRAVLAGIVTEHWLVPGWHWGKEYFGHPIYGAMVIIEHDNGLFSISGHLSATSVREGQKVIAGQEIGKLGNTGISTGPHLHFELVVSPLKYLEEQL